MNKIQQVLEHKIFENVLLTLVILNSLVLGLETYSVIMSNYGELLHAIDVTFIVIFSLEIIIKIVCYKRNFFKKSWNIFDLIIVIVTAMPFLGNVSALRALRILRALRLLSALPSFRKVIEGLARSLKDILAVLGIMILLFYVFAVLGSKLFKFHDPQHFENLGVAMLTLFQVMTLDNWTEIFNSLAIKSGAAYPYAMSFIIICVIWLLSLIVGIVANASQEEKVATLKSVEALAEQIKQLKVQIENHMNKN